MGWIDRLLRRDGGRSGVVEPLRDDPFAFIGEAGEIPPDVAYPTQESYPLLKPSAVLRAHHDQVRQAYRSFDARALMPGFDAEFARLMTSFASWVSLLPASKQYHHAKPGGLFAHSLDVATKALHYSTGFIVNQDSAPRDREADKFAWNLAAFLCGLLHDIGKVETNGLVVARAIKGANPNGYRSVAAPSHRMVWRPQVGPLTDWVERHKIESVMIEFRDTPETEGHLQRMHPYFYRIVPAMFRSFIFNSNPRIGDMVEDFLLTPGSASRAPLFAVVRDADHQSVRYDRDPRGLPGAVDLNTLIVRRFLEFATEQRFWNAPSSYFIHAYLERREGADYRHYFELDFFVATEEAIAAFGNFLRNTKNFGISLPSELERAIFDGLLKSGVLHATIPGILPVASPDETLPPWIPATTATVRYSMKLEAGSLGVPRVHPLHGDQLMFHRPLLALARSPSSGHRDYMPVVSFEGVPGLPSKTIAVRIDEDTLRPADETLDDDPAALEEIARAAGLDTEAERSDLELARGLSRVARRHRTRSRDFVQTTDRFPNLEEDWREERERLTAAPEPEVSSGETPHDRDGVVIEGAKRGRVDPAPGEDDMSFFPTSGRGAGDPAPEAEQVVPAEPAWLRFAQGDWSGSLPALGAMVWLHQRATAESETARRDGSEYVLPRSAFDEPARIRLIEDLRRHGVNIGNISKTWPALGLPAASTRQIIKPRGADAIALRPACVEILEQFEREAAE
ncbi:MAG: hypothetical protein DI556_13465 [Rhodovulum sulfidophilum]|uniref:Uncharacterized domain-containing protein n=1 Tax=Rhodovulum sulfidophilum TaxID=35806 RepID=A0A2W5N8G8_RHOSU|nr:MAG: hypothetical protein DI556_13465 [Rhodovulum sulfidophilum]